MKISVKPIAVLIALGMSLSLGSCLVVRPLPPGQQKKIGNERREPSRWPWHDNGKPKKK